MSAEVIPFARRRVVKGLGELLARIHEIALRGVRMVIGGLLVAACVVAILLSWLLAWLPER